MLETFREMTAMLESGLEPHQHLCVFLPFLTQVFRPQRGQWVDGFN
jgi:hypothetical protein